MVFNLCKGALWAENWSCFAGTGKPELVYYSHPMGLTTQRLFPAKLGPILRIPPPCWGLDGAEPPAESPFRCFTNIQAHFLRRSESPLSSPSNFTVYLAASCLVDSQSFKAMSIPQSQPFNEHPHCSGEPTGKCKVEFRRGLCKIANFPNMNPKGASKRGDCSSILLAQIITSGTYLGIGGCRMIPALYQQQAALICSAA